MNTSATGFFRDVRMPSAWNDAYSHERFELDTLAERRAEEKPRKARSWFRGLALRMSASPK